MGGGGGEGRDSNRIQHRAVQKEEIHAPANKSKERKTDRKSCASNKLSGRAICHFGRERVKRDMRNGRADKFPGNALFASSPPLSRGAQIHSRLLYKSR